MNIILRAKFVCLFYYLKTEIQSKAFKSETSGLDVELPDGIFILFFKIEFTHVITHNLHIRLSRSDPLSQIY